MTSLTSARAVVTDEYVVVPASVVDPVVVTFDGQYVWSFVAASGRRTQPARLAGAVARGDERSSQRHHLRAAG